MTCAAGKSASVLPASASLDRRIPLPTTTCGAAATAASTRISQPAGSPTGVMPPYSMPVSSTAVSVAANDALRTSSTRRATLFTSALVVARMTQAAYLTSPSRRPVTTTQLADSAGVTPYRSQKAAVSASSGSISATQIASAASCQPGLASAAATG